MPRILIERNPRNLADPQHTPPRIPLMSWRATAAVKAIRTGITRSEKLLLFCLADYHNDETEQCDPSMKRLAADALMSRRTAQTSLARLHEKRMVYVEERDLGGQTSNQYWLCCAGVELPDRLSWDTAPKRGGAEIAPPLSDEGGAAEIAGGAQQLDRTPPRSSYDAPPAQQLDRRGGAAEIALTVNEPQSDPSFFEPPTQPKADDAFAPPADDGGFPLPGELEPEAPGAFEQRVHEQLRVRMTGQNYRTWIRGAGVIRDGVILRIVASNGPAADWLRSRFMPTLELIARHFDLERVEVVSAP